MLDDFWWEQSSHDFLVRAEFSYLFLHARLHFADSIDKINNLNMFYNLADAPAMNIGTSSCVPTPAPVLSPASNIEALTFMLEVDTLFSHSNRGRTSFASCFTKRARDLKQQYPQIESSLKRTWDIEDDACPKVIFWSVMFYACNQFLKFHLKIYFKIF